MRTLLASALLTALALPVLYGLSPALRTRKGLVRLLLAALVAHGAFLLGPLVPPGLPAHAVRAPLVAWLVAALVCVLGGVPLLLLRWGRARLTPRPVDASRRQFLGELALPLAAAGLGAGGSGLAAGGFEVRHEEVRVPGLPPALDGLKVGQLTDVHVGDFIDVEDVQRAVEALDREGVDLAVMTGDLIDDLERLEPTLDALEASRAPLGMLAILGNHEKWRDERRVVEAYRRREARGRLRLLVDESATLTHAGVPLRVVGVDFPMDPGVRRRLPPDEQRARMRASAGAAWKGVAPDETVLCLTHHPDFFPHAAERGARLTLAGHTHGGQVGFWGVPLLTPVYPYRYMLGRYREGPAHLYVSPGTGHWLPFRVGIPTEVTVFTLRAA